MRLVKSQAKVTKAYLKKANKIMLEAIRTHNFIGLQQKLEQALQLLPEQAMELIKSLAEYEAQFTATKIRKIKKDDTVALSASLVASLVPKIRIKTSINSTSEPIKETYTKFVQAKTAQYMQLAKDIQTQELDDDEAEDVVNERTDGLFTMQNLALAGLAILSTANNIRGQVSDANDFQVNWVLDLELNNCPDCEEMADGSPYNFSDVDGMIQLHANCGCSLVPDFGGIDEEF